MIAMIGNYGGGMCACFRIMLTVVLRDFSTCAARLHEQWYRGVRVALAACGGGRCTWAQKEISCKVGWGNWLHFLKELHVG